MLEMFLSVIAKILIMSIKRSTVAPSMRNLLLPVSTLMNKKVVDNLIKSF